MTLDHLGECQAEVAACSGEPASARHQSLSVDVNRCQPPIAFTHNPEILHQFSSLQAESHRFPSQWDGLGLVAS